VPEASSVKVLAVDDNPEGLFVLEQLLQTAGYDVVTASTGPETLAKAAEARPDVILLDVNMPGMNGYEVTKALRADEDLRYASILLLTGRDESEDKVFGLEQGANDYVTKPYRKEELLARIAAALRTRELYQELKRAHAVSREVSRRMRDRFDFRNIIGESRVMQELFSLLAKVADSEVPVLITGESGTGKELVASAIHANGVRREKPFVVQNCSALNDNLLESELFGHVRGAFTGALRDKEGLFEVADTGTFFLDELGEMSPAMQVKLLRVLQDGTFMPVGATKPKRVNVRVVGATHRNLEEMVSKGTFREDLYYRLAVVNVRLPPLRERHGDVPRLVEYFLRSFADRSGKPMRTLDADAMQRLESYQWPGNIRQLENEIQRALVMSGNSAEKISTEHLSPQVASSNPFNAPGSHSSVGPSGEVKLKDALEHLERQMIVDTLKRCGGNKSEAARQLGVSRSNLIAKAQSYGLGGDEDEV
jgi:two-component system, NtrC family, response regulator HupR/HoxA